MCDSVLCLYGGVFIKLSFVSVCSRRFSCRPLTKRLSPKGLSNRLGYAEEIIMNIHDWSIQEEIKKRVEEESWYEWSQKSTPVLVNNYKPQKLVLSETAKYVFGSTIHFIKASVKL